MSFDRMLPIFSSDKPLSSANNEESSGMSQNVSAEWLFDKRIKTHGRFLSSAELASFLGLSEHTIRAWRKFRIITPKKFGRSVRWLLEDVFKELTEQKGSK